MVEIGLNLRNIGSVVLRLEKGIDHLGSMPIDYELPSGLRQSVQARKDPRAYRFATLSLEKADEETEKPTVPTIPPTPPRVEEKQIKQTSLRTPELSPKSLLLREKCEELFGNIWPDSSTATERSPQTIELLKSYADSYSRMYICK